MQNHDLLHTLHILRVAATTKCRPPYLHSWRVNLRQMRASSCHHSYHVKLHLQQLSQALQLLLEPKGWSVQQGQVSCQHHQGLQLGQPQGKRQPLCCAFQPVAEAQQKGQQQRDCGWVVVTASVTPRGCAHVQQLHTCRLQTSVGAACISLVGYR